MGKKEKIKLVLDTNQYISAFGWRGLSYRLYRECVARKYDIFASLSTLKELERVLHYPEFGFTSLQIASFFEQVLSQASSQSLSNPAYQDRNSNHILQVRFERSQVTNTMQQLADCNFYLKV
jgi:predicted nucleic acid-binding protein